LCTASRATQTVVSRATPGSADDGRPSQAAGCGRVPRTHEGGGARARKATPGGAVRGPGAKRADRAAPRPREIAAAAKAGRLIVSPTTSSRSPRPSSSPSVACATCLSRSLSARRGSPSAPRAGSRCRYSSTSTALASPRELTIGTAGWSSGLSSRQVTNCRRPMERRTSVVLHRPNTSPRSRCRARTAVPRRNAQAGESRWPAPAPPRLTHLHGGDHCRTCARTVLTRPASHESSPRDIPRCRHADVQVPTATSHNRHQRYRARRAVLSVVKPTLSARTGHRATGDTRHSEGPVSAPSPGIFCGQGVRTSPTRKGLIAGLRSVASREGWFIATNVPQ